MATYVAGNAAVSDRRAAGFLWATLSVLIFSGWFVITRFSVTRERLLDPLCARLFAELCTHLPAGLPAQWRATDLCASLPGSSVILRWRELRHS